MKPELNDEEVLKLMGAAIRERDHTRIKLCKDLLRARELEENARLKVVAAAKLEREACAVLAETRQERHDSHCAPECRCADGYHIAAAIRRRVEGESLVTEKKRALLKSKAACRLSRPPGPSVCYRKGSNCGNCFVQMRLSYSTWILMSTLLTTKTARSLGPLRGAY